MVVSVIEAVVVVEASVVWWLGKGGGFGGTSCDFLLLVVVGMFDSVMAVSEVVTQSMVVTGSMPGVVVVVSVVMEVGESSFPRLR